MIDGHPLIPVASIAVCVNCSMSDEISNEKKFSYFPHYCYKARNVSFEALIISSLERVCSKKIPAEAIGQTGVQCNVQHSCNRTLQLNCLLLLWSPPHQLLHSRRATSIGTHGLS